MPSSTRRDTRPVLLPAPWSTRPPLSNGPLIIEKQTNTRSCRGLQVVGGWVRAPPSLYFLRGSISVSEYQNYPQNRPTDRRHQRSAHGFRRGPTRPTKNKKKGPAPALPARVGGRRKKEKGSGRPTAPRIARADGLHGQRRLALATRHTHTQTRRRRNQRTVPRLIDGRRGAGVSRPSERAARRTGGSERRSRWRRKQKQKPKQQRRLGAGASRSQRTDARTPLASIFVRKSGRHKRPGHFESGGQALSCLFGSDHQTATVDPPDATRWRLGRGWDHGRRQAGGCGQTRPVLLPVRAPSGEDVPRLRASVLRGLLRQAARQGRVPPPFDRRRRRVGYRPDYSPLQQRKEPSR